MTGSKEIFEKGDGAESRVTPLGEQLSHTYDLDDLLEAVAIHLRGMERRIIQVERWIKAREEYEMEQREREP